MAMSTIQPDASWAALAQAEPEECSKGIRQCYGEILQLPAEGMAERVAALAQAEYTLENAALEVMTAARLRVLLAMPPDDANRLVTAYDQVFNQLPAAMAMRRAAVIQTVALHQFDADEVDGLFDLMPSVLRQVPRISTAVKDMEILKAAAAEKEAAAQRRHPAWMFWKR